MIFVSNIVIFILWIENEKHYFILKTRSTWNQESWNEMGKQKTCLEFARTGACQFGKDCKYQHNKICWEKVNHGQCSRKKCFFSHDDSIICKWDRTGECRYKENCKFVHVRKNLKGTYYQDKHREAGQQPNNTATNKMSTVHKNWQNSEIHRTNNTNRQYLITREKRYEEKNT